jgi:hypothetical protein
MTLTIDHVPIARSDLDAATEEFTRVGLEPEYGGTHADGTTHMAVVGFDDGSYLELISGTDPDIEPDLWPAFIGADAGPCAWCISVEDVAATLQRAIDAGVRVDGPQTMTRGRPDGTRAEWDIGFLGEPGGEKFPFTIADRTPRSYRVSPTESVAGGPLTGIEAVVAVRNLDASVEAFRRLFRLATPARAEIPEFGAAVASFPGDPLMLATPLDDDRGTWLTERLDTYGESPCACLLGTEDIETADEEYALREPTEWLDRRVAWFDSDELDRALGVVSRSTAAAGR